jgi:hypothetical protein
MSYRRSRARRDFESQLALATKELATLYKFAHKEGCGERLLAAYYVFAYTQLEVFIKSIVEDSIGVLNDVRPAFDKWPDLMLGYHLHKSENLAGDYRRFSHDADESVIMEKVAQAARKIGSWSTGVIALKITNTSDFLDKKKYPSPKNLPQLFKRLGVKQIWEVIGKAGKLNGKLILTSLNDLRTEIAHDGKVPLGFSLNDVRSRLNQMRRFVAALDRGVSTHFCSGVIPRADWNRAIS